MAQKEFAVIGIDSGKTGGIAIISHEGLIDAHKMPDTVQDITDLIEEYSHMYRLTGWLEKIASGLTGGKAGHMGVRSAFTFGRGFGWLEMCLAAHKIPHHYVAPGVWQRKMRCLSKGDKNVTKAAAQRLYPEVKMTHAIADAVLIAAYGYLERR